MRQTSLPPRLDVSSPTASLDCGPDIAMASDGDAPPTTAKPPPHIAARLHRASKRPSVPSSRRNSISSLHSSMSNRSGYSRTQNHHIAQHLRRASILEDRKAKLAERNAHAELVRMRAPQVKAAPKTTIKTREERTIAAQLARERHLAQVAASCAEEVKRAKKVAEETREKKAAENLKLREEMEEKLADAKKRRQQLQQNPRRQRTLSLPAVEEKTVTVKPWKPKNEALAARVIQNAWRNLVRRRAMADYLALNLDVASVQSQSFEAVSALVANQTVLSATRRMLKLCDLLDENDDPANREACVRIFLSAYLILGHPKEILSKSGDLEEELIGHSKMLLMQFQRILSRPATSKTFSVTSEPMVSLSEAYRDFQRGFAAWKSRDASFIIEGAIAQFVELDAIWQTVKNDTAGGAADDYRVGIRNNQTLILARLKRLLGSERALKMVNDAVRAARRNKAKARKKLVPAGDVKPRGAAPERAGEASSSSVSPPTSSLPSISVDPAPLHDQQAAATDPGAPGSPLKTLNSVSRVLPDNRVLVHELAISKDFRIDVDHAAEDKQVVYRATFAAMRRDVQAGRGDRWILAMAAWIKERLLRLVTPGKSFHSMIAEFLDTKTIASQQRMGSFSYEKFFSFMHTILPKLCAPVRDAEIKALSADDGSDLIDRLAKLMHVIELLALDHANFLLPQAAPELIRQAPQYEHRCFQDTLGGAPLARTTKWWRLARNRTTADLARRSPEGSSPRPPSSSRIYTTGLVDVFVGLPGAAPGFVVPETLDLDARRIDAARQDVLRIVTVAAILLTAKNLLKRDVRAQWRTQAQRMWDLSAGPPGGSAWAGSGSSATPPYADPAPYLSILDTTSGAALPPSKRASLAGTVETVLSNARASPNISHPVMKVLLRKIREHVFSRLVASSSEEKVRAAATAAEVLGAGGLAEFAGRIGALVEEMGRVRQADWDAHGSWIDKVAAAVEKEAEGEGRE